MADSATPAQPTIRHPRRALRRRRPGARRRWTSCAPQRRRSSARGPSRGRGWRARRGRWRRDRPAGGDGVEDERHRLVAVEAHRHALGDEEARALPRGGRHLAGEPRQCHAVATQQPQVRVRGVQGVPQPDGAGAGHPDVEDRLRRAEVGHRVLVAVPHRPDAHAQPALARRLGAHGAHRLAVLVAVVVDDEHVVDTALAQPRGDRARPDAVVRGQAHERVAVQAGVGGDGRDLQQPGAAEDRRGADDLRGVEVAHVGERLLVLRRALGVGDRLALTVGREAVEDHQLGRCAVGGLERELRAPQHVAAGAGGRTGERQARVDAAHGPESTPARRARRACSRRR
jgi:hypothetical protein